MVFYLSICSKFSQFYKIKQIKSSELLLNLLRKHLGEDGG